MTRPGVVVGATGVLVGAVVVPAPGVMVEAPRPVVIPDTMVDAGGVLVTVVTTTLLDQEMVVTLPLLGVGTAIFDGLAVEVETVTAEVGTVIVDSVTADVGTATDIALEEKGTVTVLVETEAADESADVGTATDV